MVVRPREHVEMRSRRDASDLESCSCAGVKLDRLLQPAILSILAKEQLNGYRVGKRLETMAMFHGRKPDPSGMYRTLKEFERRELIKAVPTQRQRAEARVYEITDLGLSCLGRWVRTLATYRQTMGGLLVHCKASLKSTGSKGSKRSYVSRSCRCRT